VILPGDDPREIVDEMLRVDYDEEFCVAPGFEPAFIAALMGAGFLVMSALIEGEGGPSFHIALPKLHLSRSALFFDKLRLPKSLSRRLGLYDLRFDSDFDRILDRCVAVHGDGWLTPPLVRAIREIRALDLPHARPASFALYRGGALVAGEFGVVSGRVYTSYSGYFDESGAGSAQIALAARYLEEKGFDFFDLGMPLDYKARFGAVDISPREFVRRFRLAQGPARAL